MSKIKWTEITNIDVINAIKKFDKENPEFPQPKSTFLIYNEKKYPAKHIRGMAYEIHYGVEISKSEFAGGMETVRFFQRLGFEMAYTGTSNFNNKQITKADIDKNIKKEKSLDIETTEQKIIKKKVKKISIPSKKVIEQKNALQLILNKLFDGDIVCEKTYSWLKTPENICGEYKTLYDSLSSYRGDTSFAKKNVVLRCDFVCESKKLIIEYDERQHFSEARKCSLESYGDISLYYDKNLWIKACEDIKAKDNSPKNRDEVRAYYDSTRDIECSKRGYYLVRIMHGQIDFEEEDAIEKLKALLPREVFGDNNKLAHSQPIKLYNNQNDKIKVCMYLQTEELKCKRYYDKHMKLVRNSDADLIVFPEFCYFSGIDVLNEVDMGDEDDINKVFDVCTALSEDLGRAVVINTYDKFGSIYSVFANAFASENETMCTYYMKHTMTDCSTFEFINYPELVESGFFEPILFKGFKIGMTICYDCNHSLFSRMYSLSGGVDLIVNSTGGNVVHDKWFKYNKARAIENSCYELVTMGGDGEIKNSKNYVYGFNPNGGQLKTININGSSDKKNVPGGLYIYEITKDLGQPEVDNSNMSETLNKKWQLEIPVNGIQNILDKSEKVTEKLYQLKNGKDNVIFCLVDGMDIMKSEKVLPLLYSKEIKKFSNRKYIIVNRHKSINKKLFDEKLSIILKVRSMENFCAVILESNNITKCYQCGKNRTAQVVKENNGFFGIDLERTSGPEAIWKNKEGMKAAWREHYEWLVNYAKKISLGYEHS